MHGAVENTLRYGLKINLIYGERRQGGGQGFCTGT